MWTDTLNTKSYIGLTGHFIDVESKKLASVTFGVRELNDKHIAEYLGQQINSMCQEWQIHSESVMSVITDNGANIVKAVSDNFGKHKHLPCFAHTLNLIATKPFDEKKETHDTKKLVSSIKNIVTFLKIASQQPMI